MRIRRKGEVVFFFKKSATPFNPFWVGSCNNNV